MKFGKIAGNGNGNGNGNGRRLSVNAGLALLALFALIIPNFVSLAAREILVLIATFALLALGLNVVVGFAGLLDLGYIAFYATGAYTWGILSGAGPIKLPFTGTAFWGEWGFWIILLVVLAINMGIGVMLGSPTLRLRGDYLAIVTLGFGEIVRIVANNLDNVTGAALGISRIPHPTIPLIGYHFGLNPVPYYYLLLLLVVVGIFVIRRLDHSRIGRAWIAIREDEVAAEAMGVPTLKMKLLAFAIGATTAGVAGVVFASKSNFVSPASFDVFASFLVLCAVVLGGMGSIPGSLAGAFVIVGVPAFLQLRFPGLDEYRYWMFGVVLVTMMIFRPQGLIPSKRREAELMLEGDPDIPAEAAT
ncbi:MAG TPA: branched-chain amino acid ABC transporter permease [Actinomycetota bacterium]|nr:branched-chain amino acid ABC transporter permease [Actinomycetota bacterium]